MTPERWLWERGSWGAQLARRALWAPSLAYGAVMRLRGRAHRTGVLRVWTAPRPVIAVGNLTVGGTGKTPLAAWIASYCTARGAVPGVVLRGYGGDEAALHRAATPGARVVEDRDRARGIRRAIAEGAQVIVLDDAFQRLDVARDLNLVMVSAESWRRPRHLLPAGPWREAWHAIRRADFAVVTRKQAPPAVVACVAQHAAAELGAGRVAVARLEIAWFSGLRTSKDFPVDVVQGRRVLAACGIGDPESFAAQLRSLGAREVVLRAWRDHHDYCEREIRALRTESAAFDYVVVTAKDAVKLRTRWPEEACEPLVAQLEVRWDSGLEHLSQALNRVMTLR